MDFVNGSHSWIHVLPLEILILELISVNRRSTHLSFRPWREIFFLAHIVRDQRFFKVKGSSTDLHKKVMKHNLFFF